MASTTSNGRMRAMQCEVRKSVVEIVLVKIDDVHLATFMIGMTARAVELLRFWKPAVKARLVHDVVADFRMAINAQLALMLTRQRCMTGSTICLDVRMTDDDRSWHDQPLLDLRRLCRSLFKKM